MRRGDQSVGSLDSSEDGRPHRAAGKEMASSKSHAVKTLNKDTKLLTDAKLFQSLNHVESPLRVDPVELLFDNCTPGAVYVMTFSIRNTTKTAQRIRISPPKTGVFSLNYIPSNSVAPGLDIRAEVQCCVPESSPSFVFSDAVVASMGPHRVEIPLLGRKPSPNFSFNPSLDIGLVAEGQTVTNALLIQNLGSVGGQVTMELSSDSALSVVPKSLSLAPRGQGASKGSFNIKFVGNNLGHFRELVNIVGTGIEEPMLLDVSAHVVVQKLTLLSKNNGTIVDNIDFGTLIYGQTKVVEAYLVNDSPLPVTFSFRDATEVVGAVPDEESPEDAAAEKPAPSIEISPMEGTIEAYGQIVIKATFVPALPKPRKGFMGAILKDLAEISVSIVKYEIYSQEVDQTCELTLQGSAALPKFTVSPLLTRFGSCPVLDRRDATLTLSNASPIPLPFDFSRIAHFKVAPSKGTLQPNQTLSVIASFTPAQLGKFKGTMHCHVGHGVRDIEIRFVGEAQPSDLKKELIGGTSALPESFKPEYKFVDPEAVKNTSKGTGFKRMEPWETLDFQQTGSSSLLVYQQAGSNLLGGSASVLEPQKVEALQKKSQNRQVYNNFLKESTSKRLETKKRALNESLRSRGVNIRSDVDGVDLGMEHGLEEPDMVVEGGHEPLWLANRAGPGADSVGGGGGGKGFHADENRLIQKKFRDAPGTQAEAKDCAAELSPEKLKSVIASHKVINFGRVNVNSVCAKNFSVSNQLLSMVLVKLGPLESELKQSRPHAQAIPAGSVAGFDITFSCREVCKYKKTFNWVINDHHVNKVTVLADVVPIELVLDRKNVTLEFPSSSLDPSISDQITVSNPGNAVAEYVWGNEGSIECIPERGSIPPGESINVTVVWTPNVAHRNDANIGLRVAGGTDTSLSVVGIFIDAKAVFDGKKMDFGAIAVGTEKKKSAVLKNVGLSPLVFSFEDLPDLAFISITPSRGMILPGESADISVVVHPRSAISLEGKNITASIRGGKPASIKLAGEAVVPRVELLQSEIDFGGVVVGSDCKMPFTLRNSGSIRCSIVLDLTSFRDFVPTLDSDDFVSSASVETEPQHAASNVTLEQMSKLQLSSALTGDHHSSVLSSSQVTPKAGAPNSLDTELCGGYKLTLAPGAVFNGFLVFAPSKPKTYNFLLPIFLQGRFHESDFKCDIKATGLASRLKVSAFSVDFGDKIVNRDSSIVVSYFQEVVFQNVDKVNGLSYEIREAPTIPINRSGETLGRADSVDSEVGESRPIYFISPTSGGLSPGESTTVRLTFMPPTNGEFQKKLHIYVEGQEDPSRPYFILHCRGFGVFPRLSFSRDSIVLPTVPLSVTTRASFTVFNNGYDGLELKYRISPNVPVPLNITFPEGNELGLIIPKVKVVISAVYETAVSWIGKIEFYDDDGEHFYIDISGCGDGCLLTNYPFVKDYSDRFGYLALDNKPINFYSKKDMVAVRAREMKIKANTRMAQLQASNPTSGTASPPGKTAHAPQELPLQLSDDGIDIDREAAAISSGRRSALIDRDVKFLIKWLNAFIVRKQISSEDYLEEILRTDGELIVDALEQMSGKKIGGLKLPEPASKLKTGGSRGAAGAGSPSIDGKVPSADAGSLDFAENSAIGVKRKRVKALLHKYKVLIEFVTKYGGLLTHLTPKSLLNLEDYVFAQEEDLRLREGERLTTSYVKERKAMWHSDWMNGCRNGWADILFQSFKTFVLYRTSYIEYCNTPGVVAPILSTDVAPAAPPAQKGMQKQKSTGGKGNEGDLLSKKKNSTKVPPEFLPSNVYSSSEAVLLAWAAFHLQKGSRLSADNQVGGSTQYQTAVLRRVVDFDADLNDMYGILHVVYSHLPDLAKDKGPLAAYSAAETEHSREANFKRLKNVLKFIQLDFNITPEELSGSSRCYLILIMHLFLNLPSFLPKSTVEFKGCLGTGKPIIKSIELRNPSQKRVTYRLSLEGSSEFSVPDNQVSLDPMTAADVLVHCNPRFTSPAKAVLTFRGIRDAGFSGTTMVFNLVSNITDIKPLEVHYRNVGLYEMDVVKILITNPFDVECVFPVTLVQKSTQTTILQLLGGNDSKTARQASNHISSFMKNNLNALGAVDGKEKKDESGAEDAQKIFQEPFWVVEQSLFLPAKGSANLTVFAIPFLLGTFSCQLIFNDQHVGQFSHDINMTVGLPSANEKLTVSLPKPELGGASQFILRICSANVNFDRAVLQSTEARLPSNRRTKARQHLQSMIASPSSDEGGTSTYLLDISSPYFTGRKDVQLTTTYTALSPQGPPGSASPDKRTAGAPVTAGGKRNACAKSMIEVLKPSDPRPAASDLENAVLLSLSPEKSGQYRSRCLFYGKENMSDIRVIEITANVIPSENSMLIEFHGAARQQLSQDIPLTNDSDVDWQLTAAVTGKGFSAPKTVTVERGRKMDFQVVFCAPASGVVDGVLTLRNSTNNEAYNYKLRGIAEEPLAEDTIYLKCNARTRSHFTIPLHAIPGISSGDTAFQSFEVETDLPYVSGAPDARVSLERAGEYHFSVMSPVSGIISGSVTFKETKTGQIIWYLVEIDVTAPLAERVIDLECPVRKVVGAEISLENPTKSVLNFIVTLTGEGLLGETTYSLNQSGAKETSPPYELIYSPLIAGRSTGSISFKNETVGEFWYKLNLTATTAEPVRLELIECMIGQSKTIQVPIENPLPEKVNMTTHLSDPRHFAVDDEIITMNPYSQTVFNLTFYPSTMNDIVSAEVIMSNPILGDVVFSVSGKGLMPGVMPPIDIVAPMSQMASKTIAFRNPFSFPLPVDVVLTTHHDEPSGRSKSPQTQDEQSPRDSDNVAAFSLLLRKPTGVVIAPESTLQLGVSFSPNKLGKYSASVEIRATLPGRNLLWCYPLSGMAAAGEPVLLPKMSTPVKTSLIKDVHIPLSGLMKCDIVKNGKPDLTEHDFTIEQIVSPEMKSQLSRCFKVQLLEVVAIGDNPNLDAGKKGNYALRFRLLFEPLRTLHTEVEIGIVCKNRGRWRADIELEAVEPPPDDVIRLVSKVGGCDKVAFTINNRFLGASPFQAYFAPHSSPHFTVSPAAGVLAPYGSEGVQFVVTFSPKKYGGRERGNLIIQTDESQWNYEVLGSYPDATIDNSAVKSKLHVDSHKK